MRPALNLRHARAGALAVAVTVVLVLASGRSPSDGGELALTADDPVTVMGVGDIAAGGASLANAMATGDLVRAVDPDAVLALGDNAYSDGTLSDFQTKYDPTWGSFKAQTHPVPGNHEYHTEGAAGYVSYFGEANVSNPVDGGLYYAWDVGNGWRAYAVNTEISTLDAQLTWLQNDLMAHPGMHYILYTHHPRYTSGTQHSPDSSICPLWNSLALTGGLEIVLAGHQHNYERFAKMDCAGNASATGARSFVAGSGGNQLYDFGTPQPGSEFRNGTDYGVLELTLHQASYTWSYIASGRGWNGSSSIDTGNAKTVIDSGSQATNSLPVPVNSAPSVDAGADQSITLPGGAVLNATVTDDGLPDPPATVTQAWSKLSGPGTVEFAKPTAVDTTATFNEAGTYVLRLTAKDSEASASDTVTVSVQSPSGVTSFDRGIATGTDDVEQLPTGYMSLDSTDLELTTDGCNQQVVGTRFTDVQVPPGATVTSAYVQFRVDEVSTGSTSITIRAEDSDDPATYSSTKGSVTSRPVIGAVPWRPVGWTSLGAAGPDQRTPNLASLVQKVVDRPGWAAGNALALQFSGTGRRTAVAFERPDPGAAVLHVEYTTASAGAG